MSIRILYGHKKKDLTESFMQEITAAIEDYKQSRLIVIIPEQFSSYYEEHLAQDKGLMRVEVMTFSRLTQRLFDLDYIQKSNTANENGKTMLVYSLLNDINLRLEYYNRSRRFPGFSVLVKKTIDDLRNNNIGYEDLLELCKREGISDTSKKKFGEIASIYEFYLKELNNKGYTDQADSYDYLCEHIKQTDSFDNAVIWFDRFSFFNAKEFSVIQRLMQKAERINVSLCMDNMQKGFESSIFNKPVMTFEKIKKEAKAQDITFFEEKLIKTTQTNSNEIDFLFDNLFETNPKIYEKPINDVTIFKAQDIYEEVEYAAIHIMDGVINRNLRYKDILLVTPDLDSYEKIVTAVFNQYNIPFYVNSRRSISDNPIIQFIASIIDIYVWDFEFRYVTKFIKSLYSIFLEDDAYEFENYILKWGIYGKRTWHMQWNYENNSYDSKINVFRQAVLTILDPFYDQIRNGCTPLQFSTHLFQLVEKLKLYDKINDGGLYKEENQAEQDKQCYNAFIGILDQLVTIMDDKKRSVDYYMNILKTALMQETVGITPMTKDCVFLTSSSRTDILDYDTVHIMGVNEGVFPMPSDSRTLFNETDLEFINENGYEISINPKERVNEEEYIIYGLMQSPTNKLCLSHYINDAEGGYVFPATIISKTRDILKEIKTLTKQDIPQYEYAYNLKTGFNLLYKNKKEAEGYYKDTEFEKFFESFEDTSGIDDKAMANLLFKDTINLSATMMEKYIKCPYSFLMLYGLSLKERTEFEYFSKDLGILKHAMLFDSMKQVCQEDNKNYTLQDICTICEQSAETLSRTNNIYKRDSVLEYIKSRAVMQTAETIKASLDILQNEALRPILFEAEFGEDKQLALVTLENNEIKIKLTGKIDRVDSAIIDDKEYYRIIDYKSSDSDTMLYKIKEGHDIQLAIYAYAYHKAKNAHLAGMYYMTVEQEYYETINSDDDSYKDNTKILKGYSFEDKTSKLFDIISDKNVKARKIVDSDVALQIFNSLEDNIKNTAQGIVEGDFKVYPLYDKEETACKYCPYKNLCGFDSKTGRYRFVEARKDDDVQW